MSILFENQSNLLKIVFACCREYFVGVLIYQAKIWLWDPVLEWIKITSSFLSLYNGFRRGYRLCRDLRILASSSPLELFLWQMWYLGISPRVSFCVIPSIDNLSAYRGILFWGFLWMLDCFYTVSLRAILVRSLTDNHHVFKLRTARLLKEFNTTYNK